MSPDGSLPGFGPADQALLAALRGQNVALRAALCTLARRGVAFRRREPDRARAWIDHLGPHPVFKAGQFLFDLMEWEDFMLDGPPPSTDTTGASALAARIAALLGLTAPTAHSDAGPNAPLPDMEAGFYLYRDVVLGGLDLALAGAALAPAS